MDLNVLLEMLTAQNLVVGAVMAAWFFDRRAFRAEAQQKDRLISELSQQMTDMSREMLSVISTTKEIASHLDVEEK